MNFGAVEQSDQSIIDKGRPFELFRSIDELERNIDSNRLAGFAKNLEQRHHAKPSNLYVKSWDDSKTFWKENISKF